MKSQMEIIGLSTLASVAVVASGIYAYHKFNSSNEPRDESRPDQGEDSTPSEQSQLTSNSRSLRNEREDENSEQLERSENSNETTVDANTETSEPLEVQPLEESTSNQSTESIIDVTDPTPELPKQDSIMVAEMDTNRPSKSLIPWQGLHLQMTIVVSSSYFDQTTEDTSMRTTLAIWYLITKCSETNKDRILNDWKRQGAHKKIYSVRSDSEMNELHQKVTEKGYIEVLLKDVCGNPSVLAIGPTCCRDVGKIMEGLELVGDIVKDKENRE